MMNPAKFGIGLIATTIWVTGLAEAVTTNLGAVTFTTLTLSTNDRILVMAPHPDDESLGCGGIIQAAVEQHIPVQVVFFTYGDNNQWSFILYRKRPVLDSKSAQSMGLMRHDEAVRAARLLGLETNQLTFLGYPDFGTLYIWDKCWGTHPAYKSMLTRTTAVPYPNALRPGAQYTGEDILQDMTTIIRDFKPTKVFISHPADHNPDHRALYLFMRVALWNLENELRPALLPYLTHFQRWPLPQGLHSANPLAPPEIMRKAANWQLFPLSSNQVSVKLAALKEHASQFRYSGKYLSSFVRQNELFGDLPAINLRATHNFNQDSSGPVDEIPALPEELTDEELAVYTDVEWNFASREDDAIVLCVNVSRPLAQTVEAEVSLFGYRTDRPFVEMPKLRISLGELNYKVMDGQQRLDNNTAKVTYRNKSISLHVPLSALGNPDRILIAAKTSRAQVPFDWVAWRILNLSADQPTR